MSALTKVKQRASLKRATITDKALFGSRKTRDGLSAIAAGFLMKIHCTRSKIKMQLGYAKDDKTVAYTNGSLIYINEPLV